jgi:hypothetical protein
MAPLLCFALWPGLAEHPRLPWLRRATIGLAALILVALAARAPLEARRGDMDELNLPVQAIAQALAARGVDTDELASLDKHLAGAMRLALPQARARHLQPGQALRTDQGSLLLIATEADWPTMVAAWPNAGTVATDTLVLPWRYGESRPERLRLRYAVVPALADNNARATSAKPSPRSPSVM